MFSKLMNSYYYGKSGKGDYRKEDLPKNRWQLFKEMLRVRLAGLCRINLMTCVAWIPMMIVIAMAANIFLGTDGIAVRQSESGASYSVLTYAEIVAEDGAVTTPASEIPVQNAIFSLLLLFVPCILITGPVQAGLAYVTRNWARDEHAFPWSDFKDAVKENWKQALGVSAISAVLPVLIFFCISFYSQMQAQSMLFLLPEMIVIMLGLLWVLALVFMYPMIVTYKMKFGQLIKNGFILAVARFPMAIGIRLCTLIPAFIGIAVAFFVNPIYSMLGMAGWYILIGNALTRFIYASYTNGVFDRFINSKIEGVEINRGMASPEDDEELTEEDDIDPITGK